MPGSVLSWSLHLTDICCWMQFRHHARPAQAERMNGYLEGTKEHVWGRQPPKREASEASWPFTEQPNRNPVILPWCTCHTTPSLEPGLLPWAGSLSTYGQVVERASYWVFLAPGFIPLNSSCAVLTNKLSLNTISLRNSSSSNLDRSA